MFQQLKYLVFDVNYVFVIRMCHRARMFKSLYAGGKNLLCQIFQSERSRLLLFALALFGKL